MPGFDNNVVYASGATITGATTINSGTAAISISTDATNNTVNIGTGAGVKTVTVGSTNTTSATVIQAGSGGVKLGTPKYPTASATSRKIIVSDGTDFTASTETWATPGSSGHILKSDGTNWTSASPAGAGASLVLIQTQTASSSASLSFTTGITGYTKYFFSFTNLICSTSGDLYLTLSTDGGSSYLATGYLSGLNYFVYNNAAGTNLNVTTKIYIAAGTGTTTFNGYIYCDAIGTAKNPTVVGQVCANNGFYLQQIYANNSTTTAINAFKFTPGSGNIDSGTITLFGVKES